MTGPAVDLAAVRAARDQLAAIVAAHPELTQPAARARLAAHLPEIATMTRRLDPNDTGASTTVGVRLPPQLLSAVEAERARLAALVPGSTIGLSDAVRSLILRALATPSTSAPAAPVAPAPMRPVVARVEAVEAPAVDPRQLPLLAPVAPVVATHTSTRGLSLATITGNDNGASPAQPKRDRSASPASSLDAAAVRARLRALSADEIARGVPKADRQWSYSRVADRVGLSKALIGKLGNGEAVSPAAVAKVAASLPAE